MLLMWACVIEHLLQTWPVHFSRLTAFNLTLLNQIVLCKQIRVDRELKMEGERGEMLHCQRDTDTNNTVNSFNGSMARRMLDPIIIIRTKQANHLYIAISWKSHVTDILSLLLVVTVERQQWKMLLFFTWLHFIIRYVARWMCVCEKPKAGAKDRVECDCGTLSALHRNACWTFRMRLIKMSNEYSQHVAMNFSYQKCQYFFECRPHAHHHFLKDSNDFFTHRLDCWYTISHGRKMISKVIIFHTLSSYSPLFLSLPHQIQMSMRTNEVLHNHHGCHMIKYYI